MPASLTEVRDYYDRNTALFLRFGSSSERRTIHRSLWPQGTKTLEEALAVSNDLVLDALRDLDRPDPRILDLGCGVGASLFHVLAGLGRGSGLGITLSSVQARLAEDSRKSLFFDRAAFVQADYHRVPLQGEFDLVYSIEALIHSQEPRRYLGEAARLLARRGRLVILDDFHNPSTDAHAGAWLQAYRDGWHVPTLQTASELTASARGLGLVLLDSRDLTPLLRLRALPDALAGSLLRLGRNLPRIHPIVPSMLGSMALQQCLRAGWLEYRWFVFEKP